MYITSKKKILRTWKKTNKLCHASQLSWQTLQPGSGVRKARTPIPAPPPTPCVMWQSLRLVRHGALLWKMKMNVQAEHLVCHDLQWASVSLLSGSGSQLVWAIDQQERLLKQSWAPSTEFLIQYVGGRARLYICISSQEMLWVWKLHLEDYYSR